MTFRNIGCEAWVDIGLESTFIEGDLQDIHVEEDANTQVLASCPSFQDIDTFHLENFIEVPQNLETTFVHMVKLTFY